MILELIDSGCDVDMIKASFAVGRVTLLQSAIEIRNSPLVKGLLERGADVKTIDQSGWTPLHSAAFSGKLDIAKLIADKIPDTAIKDHLGWTALDIAAFYKHDDIVKLLDPQSKIKTFAWVKGREKVFHSQNVRVIPGVAELGSLPLRSL